MNHTSSTQALSRKQDRMPAQHRNSGSFGHTGEIPVPNGQPFYSNGRDRAGTNGPAPFDLARSPPSNNASSKNTKHVPCKFFRQGTCQAGSACPFSHSIDPMLHQAPCKYFMKGNCKFGAKCALAHYLPNGQRVTRADLDAGLVMGGRGGFGTNSRSSTAPFPPQEAAFSDQYMQQPFTGPDYFPGQDQFPLLDDEADAYNDRYSQYQATPNFDPAVGSPPTSQFGSPPNDNGFQKSAIETRRSALNAPLPASYDANSLPHIAKYGPFGASVPDKFGMRSPPTSTLSRKLGSPPESSSLLKNSSIGSSLRNVSSPMNMSPQTTDESIGQRIMHSQKSSRPKMISASLPRSGLHDWEEGSGTETDLLPNSLHDEVLLPQEKMRRPSRPEQELSSSARSAGLNIPRRSSNVGSPPTGSSPSRFRAFFEEQRKKEESASTTNQNFGHVGSPLRETWMPHEGSDNSRGMQISGISQAMARIELNRTDSPEANSAARPMAGLRSSSNFGRFDRTVPSPGLTGRKIDEEGEGIFFEMDDEGSKRGHSAWTLPQTFPRIQPQSNGSMPSEEGTRTNGSRGIPIIGFRP